jgi:hypothetical protein
MVNSLIRLFVVLIQSSMPLSSEIAMIKFGRLALGLCLILLLVHLGEPKLYQVSSMT